MKAVMSIYTFTVFTPQVALEVIIVLAIFMLNGSLRGLLDNWSLSLIFLITLAAPILLFA